INECEPDQSDCVYGCANTKGSYECSCFWGQRGDVRTNGTGCIYSAGKIFAGMKKQYKGFSFIQCTSIIIRIID
nr:wall-associated receptor kinase 2-like [Tanacetum cinerariifolium]